MYYTPGHFFAKSATGCLVHHYSYPSAQFDGNYTLENLYGQFDGNYMFFKLMGKDGGYQRIFIIYGFNMNLWSHLILIPAQNYNFMKSICFFKSMEKGAFKFVDNQILVEGGINAKIG